MTRIMLYCLVRIFFLFTLLTPILATATIPNSRKAVNILTWWGYLDHPDIIAGAEKACGVKVSHDNYYSDDEFLRRWRQEKDSYDVIIFSGTIYNIVKNEITRLPDSRLSSLAISYNPIIAENYYRSNYQSNVVYFSLSVSGILYNSNKITISESDTAASLFQKAKGNIVVLMDDVIEESYLLNNALKGGGSPGNQNFNLTNFKKMCMNADVYVGNSFTNIYFDPNFSYSFLWSGVGIKREKKLGKDYKFIILPNISYISTDLLAQTTKSQDAECVAHYLASEKTIERIEKYHYYISPYANSFVATHSGNAEVDTIFLKSLSQLRWIKPADPNTFDSLNQTWSFIKLYFVNKANQRQA